MIKELDFTNPIIIYPISIQLNENDILKHVNYNNIILYNYCISTSARIFNIFTGKEMSQWNNKDGYKSVSLHYNGKNISAHVHRLMCMTFMPIPDPYNYQVNHINGKKDCNELYNLEWCTPKENIAHSWETGLSKTIGYNHPNSKFTEFQIYEICKMLEDGYNYREITEKLKPEEVDDIYFKTYLYDIVSGRSRLEISSLYNIHKPESEKKPLFTESQIHEICKMLVKNYKTPQILNEFGIDFYKLDDKVKHCYINCISNIKRKKMFTNISDLYF